MTKLGSAACGKTEEVPLLEYSDCSNSACESGDEEHDKSIAKGGVTTPFPWKLHDMLDSMDKEGKLHVVCWQPHGRAFMVHKPKEFVEKIMPHYFNQTKYASFQRQLNLYGFSRLSHGRDKGAYYHKCFVRGERNLCRGMIRQKIKGTKVRRSLSPEEEPNFYAPEWQRSCAVEAHLQTPVPNQPLLPHSDAASVPAVTPPTPSKPVLCKEYPPNASLISLVSQSNPSNGPMLPPPPILIKPVPIAPQISSSPNENLTSAKPVKGGDLLFFEGLPFRYLEHLEELPPVPQRTLEPNYKDTLHDMISSIVSLEPSGNYCSV